MDSLPVEIYRLIAADNEHTYRALLAIPAFARSLDAATIRNYRIGFGHYITSSLSGEKIYDFDVNLEAISAGAETAMIFCRHGYFHRRDGPAVVWPGEPMIKEWYHGGVLQRRAICRYNI